jgi:hypothetical protein
MDLRLKDVREAVAAEDEEDETEKADGGGTAASKQIRKLH